jgi:hypothetical protein
VQTLRSPRARHALAQRSPRAGALTAAAAAAAGLLRTACAANPTRFAPPMPALWLFLDAGACAALGAASTAAGAEADAAAAASAAASAAAAASASAAAVVVSPSRGTSPPAEPRPSTSLLIVASPFALLSSTDLARGRFTAALFAGDTAVDEAAASAHGISTSLSKISMMSRSPSAAATRGSAAIGGSSKGCVSTSSSATSMTPMPKPTTVILLSRSDVADAAVAATALEASLT